MIPRAAAPPVPAPFGRDLCRRWQDAYIHGDCHVLTRELCLSLNLDQAFVLRHEDDGVHDPFPVHSCVRLGDGTALDASGIVTVDVLRRRYALSRAALAVVPLSDIYGALDEEASVLALEVASRLPRLSIPVRHAAWSFRWEHYASVALDRNLAEGPFESYWDD